MDALAERILDAALAEARERPWHDLRLHALAARLGLTLPEILARYRDADAIANAHFRRLLAALTALPEDETGFAALGPRARAEGALMRWFEAALPHRAATLSMLRDKAWPSHPHHWMPMVFDLSRLVHWWREAARLDRGGVARMAEEVALTAAFLTTLAAFARDRDPALAGTRRALARALRRVPLG
jgi:AcrR family transcriptional regulator